MFASIKRLLGGRPTQDDDTQVLQSWAKAEGHTFKRVAGRQAQGCVVETSQGWRVEYGPSQRPYIDGMELRFRGDTGVPPDVQLVMVSRALAQVLESDVFSRYTNAMQTQIDTSLPDEMRWLALHPKVSLASVQSVQRRFAVFCNAQPLAQRWLEGGMLATLEEAGAHWWTDSLMVVLVLNRGMLTMRMSGDGLEPGQLKVLGTFFAQAHAGLKAVA